MKWLSDKVVGRLQSNLEGEAQTKAPELQGTRYRALKFLGRGGMGMVWLADDTDLHRNVALKVLSAEHVRPDIATRLLREAEVLARLEHPGIVPVHDAGTLADGRAFYCMKFVEGQTLDQAMIPMSLRDRLRLMQRIAEPLALAHSRGIVHRDLKPSNIMIGAFGEVLIMDWGLAKVLADRDPKAGTNAEGATTTANAPASTEHGSILGTRGFMAPEQARGEVERIDQRTDVFGLGALLRYLLQPSQQVGERPPKALAAICEKAMAEEMASRYSTVEGMSADIGRYLEGQPVDAYRENLLERTGRLVRKHQVAVVLILVYLLMRAILILFSRAG